MFKRIFFSHVATYITHVWGQVVTNEKGTRAEQIKKLDPDFGTNLRKESCVGLFTKLLGRERLDYKQLYHVNFYIYQEVVAHNLNPSTSEAYLCDFKGGLV